MPPWAITAATLSTLPVCRKFGQAAILALVRSLMLQQAILRVPGNIKGQTGMVKRSPLQVNVPDGSTCKVQGRILKLIQWHFHTPSEHSFAGRRQVMEAHFVHKDVQSGAAR